jgi:hypothetical protein
MGEANVLLKFCARACIAISLGAALTEPFAWRFPVGTRGPKAPQLRLDASQATSGVTIYRERIQHRISALRPPGRRRRLADRLPHHS